MCGLFGQICFRCITAGLGQQLLHVSIYSVHEHDFYSPWFIVMLTVGTAIVHWLYFDYILLT